MLDFLVINLRIKIETRNMFNCIRDAIEFKAHNDITKLDKSIDHLLVEIQQRKKNCVCLIGIFYQLSSENNKKIE